MKILLLFALLGAAFALTPRKQYKYQYEGKIAHGVPDVRNRVSGTGIKCTINLQVQAKEDIVIMLEKVQVGEYMGDLGCDIREPMKIAYKDIDGDGKLLEDPFMIHIHKDQDDVMLVSKSDKEWITNIRKSIAALFMIDPLRNDYPEHTLKDLGQTPYHRIQEHSIFGNCDAEYTMVQLNNSMQENEKDNWSLVRDINFDSCREQSVFQQSAIGNTTLARENQFYDVTSRSSRLSANLTYDGQSFDIRDCFVEGHVIINPFGLDHDKLLSISNQTMHLQSVSDIQKDYQITNPTKSRKTWHMESASPFSASDSSPLWVNFYNKAEDVYSPFTEESIVTGIEIQDKDIQKFKDRLNDRLEDAAQILLRVDKPIEKHHISPFDSDSARLASQMETCYRTIRALDDKATEELFDSYHNNQTRVGQLKYRLLIDTIAAGGTGGPLKVFVDQALKGKITPERAASVFFTIPNTLFSAPALPDLERYVKSLTLDKDPYATSTVWINYATTLNKVCINDRRHRYSVPHELFGTKDCDVKSNLDSILNFFDEKLQKATEDWKRIVLIHAISNLGTVQAHSNLVNIVQNRNQKDLVRVTAVYGLARNKLPDGVRDHVFKTLRPIVEKKDENEYVRQACVITLLSWRPSPSFFQSLAASTWNEPSNNMASFIYFILKSYAESTDPAIDKQSKVAKFYLPIAKPYAPSRRYTNSKLYSKYTQQDQLATDFDVSWLKRDRASKSFTEEVFAFLINSYGGLRFSVAQSSLSFSKESVNELLSHLAQVLPQEFRNVRSSEHRRAQVELADLQKRMSYRRKTSDPDYSIAFLSLFDNMEVLLPLSKDSIHKAMGEDGLKIFKELLKDREFHGTKFINPGIISMSLPTEIGLPMLIRVSMPTINGGEANVTLTADGKDCNDIGQLLRAKEIRLRMESNYRFSTKTLTMIRTLMPWNLRSSLASVESFKGLNLPATFTLSISKSQPMKNISVGLIPNYHEEFPVLQLHTVPFVALKNMWPGDPIPTSVDDKQYQVVSVSGKNDGSVEREAPINVSYTGLSGNYRFEGDFANPFNLGSYLDLIRRPEEIPSLFASPTSRMFESCIHVDFGKSKTKEIHASIAYKCDQQPKSSLQELPDMEVNAHVLLNGSESRYFEAVMKLKHEINNDKETTDFSWIQRRNPLPQFDPNHKEHCLDIKRTAPRIKTIQDLKHWLQKDIESDYEGKLQGGKSCSEKTIANFNGKWKVSSERRDRLSKEMQEDCNSDPNNPMVSFRTKPVYDDATFDLTYQDPVPRDVLNASYHFYDYVRGFAFPHIYFNYMDQKNEHGKISLRGKRYLGERAWEVKTLLPTETVKFDRFYMPKSLEQIVPVGGLSDSRDSLDTSSLVVEPNLSHECVITKTKVRVFDGFSYNYASEHCDTNAVVDREDHTAPRFMSSMEKDTGKLRGMIRLERFDTTIWFNSRSMNMNGKEIELTREPKPLKNDHQIYIGEALKTPQFIEVRIPRNFTVRVADDKITIIPSDNMRNKAGGLCGDYDGSVHVKLVGEQRCVYNDPTLFAHSWAEFHGEGCEWTQYQKDHEQVEEYRKHCPKLSEQQQDTSILPKYSKIPSDCIEYVYKIKKNGDELCVTQDVVPICYPLCKIVKPAVHAEIYDCWPVSDAPKELSRYLKRGFIRHKVNEKAESTSSFETEHAVQCMRK